MNIRRTLVAVLVAGIALVASSCTPEEVRHFNLVMGGDDITVEQANDVCDTAFGPGSDQPGGACFAAAVSAVASAQAVRESQPELLEYQGYQAFTECGEAVDYLFAGRDDLGRAQRVVYRESRNQPGAVSPTGALGCAQLTSGIRNAFLQGSWDDPYWNVLAMRDAVDDPDWGWCHWDIVNYCKAGGEF
jgi:hypothetical protein